jgi:demethylmenaquinone methyltransferase/2-methoxy-6-polyprenyl-1,4-benzoquinol methylase
MDPPHPPHPPLRKYYASERDRRGWVRDIFSRTAADYDRVERAMAFGTGSWYRRRALQSAGMRPGMVVIDVGVGTGLVAREAASIVGDPSLITGVDPSPGMVAHARVPDGVRLIAGSAEHLPLADDSADFISMGYALRHVDGLPEAFSEFYRVLKPHGIVCVLEITPPQARWAHAALKTYMRSVVPWLAARLSRHRDMPELMRYHWDTIEACVPPSAVISAARAAGFTAINREVELGIFSAYRAQKPAN